MHRVLVTLFVKACLGKIIIMLLSRLDMTKPVDWEVKPQPKENKKDQIELFSMLLLLSADFFKIDFFKDFFQEHYQNVRCF